MWSWNDKLIYKYILNINILIITRSQINFAFMIKILLEKYSLIWKKKIKHENNQEEYELSLKNIIKKYKFS